MIIEEKAPVERSFTLTVNERELRYLWHCTGERTVQQDDEDGFKDVTFGVFNDLADAVADL